MNVQRWSSGRIIVLRTHACAVESESESRSVVSGSLQPHGQYSSWNSPGQNTGVGSLSLFQWILLTQESNQGLLHCRWILFQLSYQESLHVCASVQFISVAQSCPTLVTPWIAALQASLSITHLLEFTQTHVHRVRDAIQPSHPLSSPSPPAPNPSQHQGLFQWVTSLHEA